MLFSWHTLSRRGKWLLGSTILLISITGTLILWSNCRIASFSGQVVTSAYQLGNHRVGLVLGTAPRLSAGQPNLYFRYRIDAAEKLYRSGQIDCLILSGDNRRMDYNEPAAMRDALVARGVPREKLVMDFAGFRTLDSVVRAKEIFGAERLVIVSQQFHCERALYLAEAHGIDAVGFAAQDVRSRRYRLRRQLRESVARMAAWIDINLLHTKPYFLGEKIQLPQKQRYNL